MLEDEILKWQFKCGNRDALAQIYRKYADPMLTLAMGLLNDAHAAEDVVQDVFTAFARSANGFALRGSLKAYLTTAVVNRIRDHWRRRLRRPGALTDDLPIATETRGPDEELIFTEDALRLNEALAQLPSEQREAVLLRVKGKMRFKEIAKLQGISVNTALGRYRYGLQKLRSSLNGEVHK
ncbi:MAG: sigma-70 family RNA polymerase sigma factor [Sedimentisphaerales bacterium]|nr:sigma-70 family RNA polymerase sigma factor [Sedimentisphaerales bacterium]